MIEFFENINNFFKIIKNTIVSIIDFIPSIFDFLTKSMDLLPLPIKASILAVFGLITALIIYRFLRGK